MTPYRFWTAVLPLAAVALLPGCGGRPAEGIDRIARDTLFESGAVPVETLRLTPQAFDEEFDAAGSIEAQEEVTISAEIAGRIVAVHREIGDRVTQGRLLVALDARAIKAQVNKVEAQLQRAKTELDWAERDLERQERLFQDQVAAERALDEARRRMDTSENDVAAQQAELEIAQVDLDRATIRSPIAGLVARRHVSAGEYVTPGTKLYDLVATDKVKFTFSVAERDVTGIRPGDAITLRIDAHPKRSFQGKVRAVSPAGSELTHTFRVELELMNDEESPLLPGMSGRARVVRGHFEQVFLLPEAAILRDGASSYIYLAVEQQARRRDIEIVSQTGSLAVVAAELGEELECIILGQAAVAEGTEIRVRRAHDQPPRLGFD